MRDEEALVAVVALMLFFGIPICAIVCHYFHATVKVFFETRLKREMIARGFSAAEIAQVVTCKAGGKNPYDAHGIPPAKPIRQPQYAN